MQIQAIEENIKYLDAILKGIESKTITQEKIVGTLRKEKNSWEVLLQEELSLQRKLVQDAKLDRTLKINSFLLRIFSAFGVIMISIIAFNSASKMGLDVPWIFSRNAITTSMSSSTENHLNLKSNGEQEEVLSVNNGNGE